MKEISQELLEKYIDGEATLDEMAEISLAFKDNPEFKQMVSVLEEMKDKGMLNEDNGEIPMASMAAMSEGNLCDVMCEQYILKDYVSGKTPFDYVEETLDNCWLKESGTPLHNIGRLLEKHGMSVSRQYNCSERDLMSYLENHYKIIAVVDYGQLWNKESDGIFHAVVCLSVNNGIIRIFDPASNGCGNYDLKDFEKAWRYSKNYLVYASSGKLEYVPHPIDVSDIDLDDDLLELTEAIAENAHEVWAEARRSEGWKFGPKRNDALLEHPDMIPYFELSEGEKYYDRAMALNTIRLVKKLGFSISRKNTMYCNQCGEFVADNMNFCPHCGSRMNKEN